MLRAFTGNTLKANGIEDKLFKWEWSKLYVRCEVEVWHE
jgi:hypothetical protein